MKKFQFLSFVAIAAFAFMVGGASDVTPLRTVVTLR